MNCRDEDTCITLRSSFHNEHHQGYLIAINDDAKHSLLGSCKMDEIVFELWLHFSPKLHIHTNEWSAIPKWNVRQQWNMTLPMQSMRECIRQRQKHWEMIPSEMRENPNRLTPRRSETAHHFYHGSLLHDFDSLPTVDSGKAGGSGDLPCRDNLRIVWWKRKKK